MHRILLVEDDDYKCKVIQEFVTTRTSTPLNHVCKSINSAMQTLENETYTLVLLDMSLPWTNRVDSSGAAESFGGLEVMSFIDRMELAIKVIVITQFERLGTGDNTMDISSLTHKLQDEMPEMFIGLVYFNSTSSDWKVKLSDLLKLAGIE
jgi:CheY-like chemotaxis protein